MQEELAPAVAVLNRRLGDISAAVIFEVQFAHHSRQFLGVSFEQGKELVTAALRGAWHALQVAHAIEDFQHPRGRAATAIAIAEEHQAVLGTHVIFVVAGIIAQPGDLVLAIVNRRQGAVIVRRRKVGQHLAAVDALPGKGVMRGWIEAVPRELHRQEARDSTLLHDLR